MLPAEWPLVVYEKTRDRFAVVKKLLNERDTEFPVARPSARPASVHGGERLVAGTAPGGCTSS